MVGATSAVAAAVIDRLVARGDRLFLVARTAERLEPLLARHGAAVVGHRLLDLATPAGIPEVVDEAWRALGEVDWVLIAHGWLPDQLRTEEDADEALRTLAVNLGSVVALLVPIAARMEAAGRGTIGVITSVAGERGRPRNYTYGAAKGGLSVYLQGLRSRLWSRGVAVCDLRPGPIVSPMTEGHPRNALFATPDGVADRIVAALERGRAVTWLPWYWRPVLAVVRWLPEPIFQRFGFLAGR